ncbi:MAG: NAD-dependent DNA ligase LigA [Christensenellaceae bacterium]|jgi:DNA ligase (NAD+)|nr:NAD-dependent DNA ligase LigA [Christensenellaceae bacterium]
MYSIDKPKKLSYFIKRISALPIKDENAKNFASISRMMELIEEINKHNASYYDKDAPLVSDAEYDKLYTELSKLEKTKRIQFKNSPTLRVGGKILDGFKPYQHRSKLYSLDKAQSFDELANFFERIGKDTKSPSQEFVVEYKFDGLTLSLIYDKGELVLGATRGDGEVGENVTAQVKTIDSIPLKIKYKGRVEIQGEAIMRLSAFNRYNSSAAVPLKNPRNAAAGAIRNIDPKNTEKRKLSFFAYNVSYCELNINSQLEMLEFLTSNGFYVEKPLAVVHNISEAKIVLNDVERARKNLDFLIDGAVLKLNPVGPRAKIGYTEKFPKWSIAYKFKASELTTTLTAVVWKVSRTSRINPVAVFDPVNFDGVTIQNASLNNIADIKKKDLKLNSRILVRRANDVIPQIMGVCTHTEQSKEIEIPRVCPSCNANVTSESDFIYCTNPENCPETIIATLVHFASVSCMDINGFSEKTAGLIYRELNVRSIVDLYRIKVADLLKLDGFSNKGATKMVSAINESKKVALSKFIYALGIPGIGGKAAKDLAQKYKSTSGLLKAEYGELLSLDKFGEKSANNFIEYISNEKNRIAIEKLSCLGICANTDANETKIDFIKWLTHFGSESCMNIFALTEEMAKLLYERVDVRTIVDIYRLKETDFWKISEINSENLKRMLKSIEESKNTTLDRFIRSFKILGVGEMESKILSNHYGSIDNLFDTWFDELANCGEFNNETVNSIMQFVSNENNRLCIKRLLALGVCRNVSGNEKDGSLSFECLERFGSRLGMNIKGFNKKTIELILKSNIKSFDELYTLSIEDLKKIDGITETSAKALVDAIKESKNASLAQFIYALGIFGIKEKESNILAQRYGTLDNFVNAWFDELIKLEIFNEDEIVNLMKYISTPSNRLTIKNLQTLGICNTEITTTLKDFVWQIMPDSKLTAIGIFDSIEVGGKKVEFAAISEIDMENIDIRVGDLVTVKCFGDSYKITSSQRQTEDATKIMAPRVCPYCGAPLKTVNQDMYCTNSENCKSKSFSG